MKKYLFVLATILCTFCTYSCKETKEEKIKEAFKNYAKNNFDNPNSIIEIVGVDFIDTLSTREDKERARTFYSLFKQTASSADSVSKAVFDFMMTHPGKLRGMNDARKLSVEVVQIRGLRLDLAMDGMLHYKEIDEDYKQLLSCKDTTSYIINLKYRVKENGQVKIKKIECISDTLFKNICFNKSDGKNIWVDYLDKIQTFVEKHETEYKLNAKELSLNKEVAYLIEKKFGVKIIK